jgi:hypothetical protein
MNKAISKLNTWCNNHIGLLALLTLAATVVAPYLTELSSIPLTKWANNMAKILGQRFTLSLYQILIVTIGLLFYLSRLRRKYRIQSISQKILVGTWKNEWGPPNAGQEILKITEDMKYYINGQHYFNIEDFHFDPQKNIIQFLKVGAREDDRRQVLNTLTIKNNYTLVGTEQDWPIRYTKISD